MPRGYSLIEMMVVLAISAYLLVMLVPPLQESHAMGYRSEARLQLHEKMLELQASRFDASTAAHQSLSWLAPSGRYRIRLYPQAQRWLLQAEAIGPQRVDSQCQTLWLDDAGQQGSAPSNQCWEGR